MKRPLKRVPKLLRPQSVVQLPQDSLLPADVSRLLPSAAALPPAESSRRPPVLLFFLFLAACTKSFDNGCERKFGFSAHSLAAVQGPGQFVKAYSSG